MKQINIRFERDLSIDTIEILIRASEQDGEVAALMERLIEKKTIAVYDGKGSICELRTDEIILVIVDGNVLNVITDNGIWYARRTLQSLEEELKGMRFVRISRFELVNLDRVLRYEFVDTKKLRLELECGMETWASRRCIPEIRRRLKGKG